MDITIDGTTIDGQTINEGINIKANNVTIMNSKVDAHGPLYGINATFLDSTGEPFRNFRLIKTKVTNFIGTLIYVQNAFVSRCSFVEGGEDAVKIGNNGTNHDSNTIIEYCLMRHTGTQPGSHADGIQWRGGKNLTIRYNRIIYPITDDELGYSTNSALFMSADQYPLENLQIYGNYFDGGNYTVYIDNRPGSHDVILSNNYFDRHYRFGVLSLLSAENIEIDGNRWFDTLEFMDINNWDE